MVPKELHFCLQNTCPQQNTLKLLPVYKLTASLVVLQSWLAEGFGANGNGFEGSAFGEPQAAPQSKPASQPTQSAVVQSAPQPSQAADPFSLI